MPVNCRNKNINSKKYSLRHFVNVNPYCVVAALTSLHVLNCVPLMNLLNLPYAADMDAILEVLHKHTVQHHLLQTKIQHNYVYK